jgi:hypothetical protein
MINLYDVKLKKWKSANMQLIMKMSITEFDNLYPNV